GPAPQRALARQDRPMGARGHARHLGEGLRRAAHARLHAQAPRVAADDLRVDLPARAAGRGRRGRCRHGALSFGTAGDRGGPLALRLLDPTTMNTLYGAVVAKGGNPEGAQVLLAWLSTPEGAAAYEGAIGRGNPLIKGTETAQRVSGRKLVEFGFQDATAIERLDAELTQMLMAASKKR